MTNLQEKYLNWVNKVKEGKKNHTMIARCEEGWFLITQNHVDTITSLKVAVDRGYGLEPDYEYDITKPDTDGICMSIVIKDENKMIVHDKNGEYAFGIEGEISPARAFFIYIRTEDLHSFVFANQKCCSINMIHALAIEESDAITCFMDDVFEFEKPVESNPEEVQANG